MLYFQVPTNQKESINQPTNQPTNQENLILYKSNFALQLHKQTLQKVACSKVVARRGEKTLKNAKAYERE